MTTTLEIVDMGLTNQQAPFTEPYAIAGNSKGFKSKGNTALACKRALAHLGFLPWEPDKWDNHWNEKLNDASAKWKRKRGLIPADSNDGSWGTKAHDVMRSALYTKDGKQQPAFDSKAQDLLQKEKAGQAEPAVGDSVPDLGPIFQSGLSVLDHDLTHATSGISLYPAFDDAFSPKPHGGITVIAFDNLTVWKHETSSNPGHAIYVQGAQKVDAWYGHLDRDYPLGHKFKKGEFIAKTIDNEIGGGPHCHVGINVERLIGAGKELEHHTNYTHGAPTVGEQLSKLLI